ncbi:10342_t:CDS:1, partial [Entrophospora sp. SA101]
MFGCHMNDPGYPENKIQETRFLFSTALRLILFSSVIYPEVEP